MYPSVLHILKNKETTEGCVVSLAKQCISGKDNLTREGPCLNFYLYTLLILLNNSRNNFLAEHMSIYSIFTRQTNFINPSTNYTLFG